MPVGQIVSRMNEVRSTKEVVLEMVEEYIDTTQKMARDLDRRAPDWHQVSDGQHEYELVLVDEPAPQCGASRSTAPRSATRSTTRCAAS